MQRRGFGSQHQHSSWWPSVISVPRDLMTFSGLHGHRACMLCTDISGRPNTHIKHKYIWKGKEGSDPGFQYISLVVVSMGLALACPLSISGSRSEFWLFSHSLYIATQKALCEKQTSPEACMCGCLLWQRRDCCEQRQQSWQPWEHFVH